MPNRKLFSATLFFSLLIAFSLQCTPFTIAEEDRTDREVLVRESEAAELVAKTAKKSRQKARLEQLREISFDQVLQDPDNVGLNVKYAKKQVKDGNLLGAAATLERVLLIDPDIHKVRLFYAVVLYRLDNVPEARRELQTLSELKLPAGLSAEVKQYQQQIERRERKTHFGLRQSLGWQIDDNRNAAPSTKRRFFLGAPLPAASKTRDTSFLSITGFDVTHHVGKHQLLGNFTYFHQEQTIRDNLDLQSFQYDLGAKLKTPFFDFTPKFFANHVFLSRQSFLRTQGGSFEVEKKLTKKLEVFSKSSISRLDFLPISENAAARQRKGRLFSIDAGFQYALWKYLRVGSSFVYANRSAEEDFNGYEQIIWRSNLLTLLPKGHFIIQNLDLGKDLYDEEDVAIARIKRRDKSLRYRVTYGAPLKAFGLKKILPKTLHDVTVTAAYEYFRADSNITNFAFRNNKFQMMVSKKWRF